MFARASNQSTTSAPQICILTPSSRAAVLVDYRNSIRLGPTLISFTFLSLSLSFSLSLSPSLPLRLFLCLVYNIHHHTQSKCILNLHTKTLQDIARTHAHTHTHTHTHLYMSLDRALWCPSMLHPSAHRNTNGLPIDWKKRGSKGRYTVPAKDKRKKLRA